MRWIALALLTTGCVDNAILQVDLTIESLAGETSPTPVQVEAQAGPTFNPDLEDATRRTDLTDRSAGAPAQLSVIAIDDFDVPLWLRLRVCDPDCDRPRETYVVRVERAFYRGAETRVVRTLTPTDVYAGPGDEVTIERCDVQGCEPGTPTDYCTTDAGDFPPGLHFCEVR